MTTIKIKMTCTTRRRLMALAAVVTSTLVGAVGCELAVDFDRTKIDAGAVDASISEGGADSTLPPDANATDANTDAGVDAPATDAGVDADDGAVDADDGAVDADNG